MAAQSDNEIKDIIKDWIRTGTDQIHTALPARVVRYDAEQNKAQVQPVGYYKTKDGRNITFPIIHDVPVVFPMGVGGTAGMTFPVVGGDGCLVVFSESQMDDFLNEGYDSDDLRMHDMRDAICIPGLYAPQVSSSRASQTSVNIFIGNTMITITDGHVDISGAYLTVSGDVIGGGISLDYHVHTGCEGGTTGIPIGNMGGRTNGL